MNEISENEKARLINSEQQQQQQFYKPSVKRLSLTSRNLNDQSSCKFFFMIHLLFLLLSLYELFYSF